MITVKVLVAEQKDVRLYLGFLPCHVLIKHKRTDRWSSSNPDGYQRQLMPKRVSDGARYLMESNGIFPSPVLVSIRGAATFHGETSVNGVNSGLLQLPDEEPLWVVDGQHRLAYLEEAIKNGECSLENYPVLVTFLLNPTKLDEVHAFYTINSSAESVPENDVSRLLERMQYKHGVQRRNLD